MEMGARKGGREGEWREGREWVAVDLIKFEMKLTPMPLFPF